MDPASKLPPEILFSIFLFTDNELKDLASVSKNWDQTIKTGLSNLFSHYTQSESLKPYTDLAKKTYIFKDQEKEVEINIQRIKFVFNKVILKAQEMGYQQESLTIHNLSATHLQEIAKWIEEQEAKNLNVFASQIDKMKPFLASLKDLSDLQKAQAIRLWMEQNQNTLKDMIELNLEDCHLSTLPKEIKYFLGLQNLHLYNNQLMTIPSEIGLLTQLQRLVIINNKLKDLPIEISSLTHLEHLYLNDNQFSEIPSHICSLNQLQELDFSNNQIRSIPSQIGALIQLQIINLSNNQIKEIPNQLGSLTNLLVLNLNNNQIKAIPSEIDSSIQDAISIENNQFNEFEG